MKIKKLGALLVSAALCAGMAAPAFAFEGEAAPVEQPVLPEGSGRCCHCHGRNLWCPDPRRAI